MMEPQELEQRELDRRAIITSGVAQGILSSGFKFTYDNSGNLVPINDNQGGTTDASYLLANVVEKFTTKLMEIV